MDRLIKKYPDSGLYGSKYYKFKNQISKEADISIEKNFIDGFINYFDVYLKTMWMPFFPSSVILTKEIFLRI